MKYEYTRTNYDLPLDRKLENINEAIDLLIANPVYGQLANKILNVHPIYKTEIDPKYNSMVHEINWTDQIRKDTVILEYKDI